MPTSPEWLKYFNRVFHEKHKVNNVGKASFLTFTGKKYSPHIKYTSSGIKFGDLFFSPI